VADIPGIGAQSPEELVQPIDLFPTFLSLFDVPPKGEYDGKNLLPLLKGNHSDEWRDEVFIEEAYTQRRTAIRTDEWKYITHQPDKTLEEKWGSSLECRYCKKIHGAEEELYHLISDPEEKENCIDKNQSVVEDLRKRVEQFEQAIEYPETDSTAESPQFDDEKEVLQRLENLGYK
jgi:arylsulfatase A-like enzyme